MNKLQFPSELIGELELLLRKSWKDADGKPVNEWGLVEGWTLDSCEFQDQERTAILIRYSSQEGSDITLIAYAESFPVQLGLIAKAGPGYSALADYLSMQIMETVEPCPRDYVGTITIGYEIAPVMNPQPPNSDSATGVWIT